jgi:hypothetical protein
MAIFLHSCAICDGQITEATPYLATSGCAFPEGHPLWKYCDTGLHQACLADWEHRRVFAEAYSANGGAHLLLEHEQWVLYCGPIVYGPHGKVQHPYYAEIRLREWPARLYSRFHEWDAFIRERQWEQNHIEPLNDHIRSLVAGFPPSSAELEGLLLPHVLAMLERGPAHRTRYVAILALELLGDKARTAIPLLRNALDDEHGSVRQAAHMLLKRWQAGAGGA